MGAYRVQMRVVLAGDSHLTETSPRRRVTKLAPRLRSLGHDVMSVAVGGASSRDVLRQKIPTDADWVLYSLGVNDAAPWKLVALDEFAANCDRILSTGGPTRRLVLGPGPVIERRVPGERTNAGLAEYGAVLERAATTHSAQFVPLAAVLDEADLADDGVHYDDSGYAKVTDCVLVELYMPRKRLTPRAGLAGH